MSYIPDTREPISSFFTRHGKERPNAYYEGLLNEEDKKDMESYDHGVQDVVNGLNNFDVCYELAEEYLSDEIPEGQETYFTEQEQEFLLSDKVTRFIRIALLHWAELERNENVVCKIDSYSESEDEEIHAKKYLEMEEDYKKLSKEEFEEKYPNREYNEHGGYDE